MSAISSGSPQPVRSYPGLTQPSRSAHTEITTSANAADTVQFSGKTSKISSVPRFKGREYEHDFDELDAPQKKKGSFLGAVLKGGATAAALGTFGVIGSVLGFIPFMHWLWAASIPAMIASVPVGGYVFYKSMKG